MPMTHPDGAPHNFQGLVYRSSIMFELVQRIRRAAHSDATVLVRGESGVGKELVASAIHAASPRASKPFRAVNCATFTPELLASALFGHVKGAFTGAVRDKAGLFSQANGGTLFLDEVAELPMEIQARLLRIIQEQRFVPVGGTRETSVNVRLVSATNMSLRQLVRQRRFREDLMYRLRVVVLRVPALRQRPADLSALTWHFIDEFNQQGRRQVTALSDEAWDAMRRYGWPGNVRELRNNIEQAFVLGDGSTITFDELAPELQGLGPEVEPLWDAHAHIPAPVLREPVVNGGYLAVAPPMPGSTVPMPSLKEPVIDNRTLDQLERDRLVAAYEATGGHRVQMAERLGMSRSTLYRKLKKHGLT